MTRYEPTRRQFLQDMTILGVGFGIAGCTGAPPSTGGPNGGPEAPELEGGEVITDPARFPTKFNESPEFAELVRAGKLPQVAERVGSDPLVIKPVREIGKYGGTLRRGFLGVGDYVNGMRFCAGPDNLLYWDYRMERVIPNIARDYELTDGNRVLVLHLRRGMHWSDGTPFTAEDILFWRNEISLNPDIGSPTVLRHDGKEITVRKVDDHTVEFIAPAPLPLLPALLAGYTDIGGMAANSSSGGGGFAPKHYLQQFHPAYTSAAQADRLATDAGFDSWAAYFGDRNTWYVNTELPSLTPWVLTRPISNSPWTFEANPYSIWVDTEGNQLPYIREISMGVAENTEIITLRTVSGEYDFQDRHLAVASLPVLVQNQDKGGYTTHRAPLSEMDYGLRINLAYDKDPALGALIRTTDFRRALSLGIDRSQINASFFLDTSTPSATMAADNSRYFPGREWRTKWATHDPKQANTLLDRIGLTTKDTAGYRLRPDQAERIRLDYQCVRSFNDFPGMGEMIREHWKAIGIELTINTVEPNLLTERAISNDLMLSGHQVGTDDPFLRPDTLLPTVTNAYTGMIGIPYAKWFATNGSDGVEPPEAVSLLKKAMELYREGLTASDDERTELGKEIFKLHADQVWTIGVVGFGLGIYGIYTANNELGNVPRRIRNTLHQKTPSNALPMTFYYT